MSVMASLSLLLFQPAKKLLLAAAGDDVVFVLPPVKDVVCGASVAVGEAKECWDGAAAAATAWFDVPLVEFQAEATAGVWLFCCDAKPSGGGATGGGGNVAVEKRGCVGAAGT